MIDIDRHCDALVFDGLQDKDPRRPLSVKKIEKRRS